jgi:hypothetical protein
MARRRGPEHIGLAAGRVLASLEIQKGGSRSPRQLREVAQEGGVTGSEPEWVAPHRQRTIPQWGVQRGAMACVLGIARQW